MKRVKKAIVTRSPEELALHLGLTAADGVELELRRQLTDKIIDVANRTGITHAELAARTGTSRTRLTAILNRNTQHVSTDLLLRILTSLGYAARVSFRRCRPAA